MESARDYECPICMMLMIEPVLLPCKHELCYKCFILGYTNTNDQCPFCRVRIATWARKAMKNNRVVNTAKWDLIKRLFPDRVKCIQEGKDIVSDEEETEMQIIAEAGSLGKEYMAELEKVESERLQASQKEEAASLALIEKLCQAEGQPFILPSLKVDSTSRSSDVVAALMPNDRTYSITDEDRLKQIKEEEMASLRLIQQLQEEEVQALRERQKHEELDLQYARMIASVLNKPLPTEPAVDLSDCVVICPSSPCASLTSVCVDGSSPTSSASASASASASILPLTSSVANPVSTEAIDKVVTPSAIYHKWELNGKGKKTAAITALTKWLKMSEAALGSNSESGVNLSYLQPSTSALGDPVATNPPTHTNIGSAGELATELLCTVSRPNATDDTSLQDISSEVCAIVIKPDPTNCEQLQTFVHSEFPCAVSKEFTQDVVTSEVDHVFGSGVLESHFPRREVAKESDSIGTRGNGSASYSGQRNEIPSTDDAMEGSISHNSDLLPDLLPAAFGSQIEARKQRRTKRGISIDAICDATGMLGTIPTRRKSYRSRSSALATPAKKSLKRNIIYLTDDAEPCCSSSSVSQTTCDSVLPNSSCSSAEKKICLDLSAPRPKILLGSETVADTFPSTRSDFNSDESFRLFLEEHDHRVALRLQRMFDMESRPQKIPKNAEPAP